jgi:hypothetical protein
MRTFVLVTCRHPIRVRGKRLPGKLTASFRRLQELVESTPHVDFKSLRERERESTSSRVSVFVFLAERVFWNRSCGYGERWWRRWRQNSCKSVIESFGMFCSGLWWCRYEQKRIEIYALWQMLTEPSNGWIGASFGLISYGNWQVHHMFELGVVAPNMYLSCLV